MVSANPNTTLMVSLSNHERTTSSFDKLRMRQGKHLMVNLLNHEGHATSSFDKLRMRS
jgi:hypothetical protein